MSKTGLFAVGVAISLGFNGCKKKEDAPPPEPPPAPEADAAKPAADSVPLAPGATAPAAAEQAMASPKDMPPQALGGLEGVSGTTKVKITSPTVTMTSVTVAVRKFKGKNGKLPESVEDLIAAGLIPAGPQVPKGFKVSIVDSASGGEAKLVKQ